MGGRILPEDVDAVREATDVVAIIGERVALKKAGRQFAGLCPFHTEKTASFYVSPEKGVYHCHGCNASGNVFTFLRQVDGLDFADAVEMLAQKVGITLRYESGPSRPDTGSQRRRLVAAHEHAVTFYHELFMKSPEAGTARGYWRQRGFDGADSEPFLIGYAPDAWDRLVRQLTGAGITEDTLVEAGLAVRSRTGRAIDRFRNRLLFPLHNQAGEPIGFGARALPGGGDPKYLNSPESALYSKSRVLYNLHRARGDILATREVVVVEGYTDVIALAKAGVGNAVATCGTALGEPHLEMLRRYGPGGEGLKVVLAFDSDSAGRAAGERGFDLYAKFDLDIRAAAFPEGQDPADVALTDPDGARRAVADAVPLMEFKLRTILARRPGRDPESRARALRAAVAALAVHPDPLARDAWSLWLAETLRIDKALVDRELKKVRAGAPVEGVMRSRPGARTASGARAAKEAELVRVALFGPSDLADRARRWPADDLSDERVARSLEALTTHSSVASAVSELADDAGAFLASCAVEEPDVDDVDVWAKEVLVRLEGEQVARAERSVQVDDVDDLARQIELIQKRHVLLEER